MQELQGEEEVNEAITKLEDTDANRLIAQTQTHINYFANSGLRTMMVAWRPVEKQMYEKWRHHVKCGKETLDLKEQEKILDRLNEQMECRLICLGATAIEDKLQANVGRTLHNMKRAGTT